MAVHFEPWPCEEIVRYSDLYGGTFRNVGGAWTHEFPQFPVDRYGQPVKRANLIKDLTPHIKARAAELKEYLRLIYPTEREREAEAADRRKDETGKEYRARIIRDLQDAARANGRTLYYCDPFPRYEIKDDGLNGVPDTATSAVIAGIGPPPMPKGKYHQRPFNEGGPGKWTALPNPVSYESAERRLKLRRAKKRLRKLKKKEANTAWNNG